MTDNFTTLERPADLDTKGWDINFHQLKTPKRGIYPHLYFRDDLFESPDKKFACLFYTITEFRMGWETGLIAIFENKFKPTLLVNPINQWFDYQSDRSLVFIDNYLFVRKLAYNENEKLSGTPFVVFDLTRKLFGFVDFDLTSIYYSPLKVSDTLFKFNLDKPDELKNSNAVNRNDEIFDIHSIKFYKFDKLNNLSQIYFEEKKNAC